MKKIIISMGFYAVMVASCQKETTDSNADQILNSTNSGTALIAGAADQSIVMDSRGGHKPGKDSSDCIRIPLDQLPQSIKDYVSTNYTGATMEFALKDKAGNYFTIVKLSDGSFKILQFDANGNFLKELDRKLTKPKNPRSHLMKVDPTTLLPAIISYINTNYAGATILKAGTTPNGDFIVLISENNNHKALLFDANGNFIKELK
jgi:hypothetical protein